MGITNHTPTRLREGDKVRDRANVGGQVLEVWGNGVKVSWNNGHTGWIDARFLIADPRYNTAAAEEQARR